MIGRRRSERCAIAAGLLSLVLVGCAATGRVAPTESRTDRPRWGAPEFDAEVRPVVALDEDGSIDDDDMPIESALPDDDIYPIDISSSLRLAVIENPTIAGTEAALLEALANQTAARVLLVPTLNAGANYHGHDGVSQRTAGRIFRVSQQSLYFGGGAYAFGSNPAQIPAVNISSPLADAIFEPLAARRQVLERRHDVDAVGNEILRDVALRYVDLSQAIAEREAQRRSERETFAVVRLTRDYAEAGEGRPSDLERARTDRRLRRVEVLRAEEAIGVASARLSELLNLDPSIRLMPIGPLGNPIELAPVDLPTEDLVREALARRPEMSARAARIDQAEVRFRQERARPWLPTIWVGFSGAGFGGGSNLVPPLVGNFGGRTDFDVRLFWTVRNLGAGNGSIIANRRAELGRTRAEQSQMVVRIRREVVEAQAEAKAARARVSASRQGLATAEQGYELDLERARNNLVRPIEVLNSVALLADARIGLIRSIADSDRQQYRLFVALGSPPPPGPGSEGAGLDAPGS